MVRALGRVFRHCLGGRWGVWGVFLSLWKGDLLISLKIGKNSKMESGVGYSVGYEYILQK
jgi:hypothetical protein